MCFHCEFFSRFLSIYTCNNVKHTCECTHIYIWVIYFFYKIKITLAMLFYILLFYLSNSYTYIFIQSHWNYLLRYLGHCEVCTFIEFSQSLYHSMSSVNVNYYFYQRDYMKKVTSRQIFNSICRKIYGQRELSKI